MNIGSLIRELRKKVGMTQMVLGDKIGVSYQQVQKYEKNTNVPRIPRLKQIADVFGVSFMVFIEEDNTNTTEETQLLNLFRKIKGKKRKNALMSYLEGLLSVTNQKKYVKT